MFRIALLQKTGLANRQLFLLQEVALSSCVSDVHMKDLRDKREIRQSSQDLKYDKDDKNR